MSNVIDLSQVPAPDVVETLDYEAILADRKAALVAHFPADEQDEVAATLALESEPLTKALEENAERELVLRSRINEAAQAVMLPYAKGTDLDNLATLFGVERQVTDEGDPDATPPVPPEMESDSDLRDRIQLSLIGMSTAGPAGAYIYWARSAHGDVADAGVDKPTFNAVARDGDQIKFEIDDDAGLDHPLPGDVIISVLSREGNGVPSQDVLDAVHDQLYQDNIRPLTDHPIVQAITPIDYKVKAAIKVFDGPDFSVVKEDARKELNQYIDDSRYVGRDIAISGIYRALHRPGVAEVTLEQPTEDVKVNRRQAAHCTDIDLSYGGTYGRG
jgi:phage-related baseplate assembly protein